MGFVKDDVGAQPAFPFTYSVKNRRDQTTASERVSNRVLCFWVLFNFSNSNHSIRTLFENLIVMSCMS